MKPGIGDRGSGIGDPRLEQELEQLLSVEPSPEFQARVRTRIAHEAVAASGGGLWGWLGPPAMALVAVCLVLVMVVVRWTQGTPDANTQARVTPTVPARQPVAPSPVTHADTALADPSTTVGRETLRGIAPSAVRRTGDRAVTAVVVPVAAPYDPFSDVLVSTNELKALRQIQALMSGRALKEEEPSRVAAVREDMTELVIAPITIEPIQLAAIKGDAE